MTISKRDHQLSHQILEEKLAELTHKLSYKLPADLAAVLQRGFVYQINMPVTKADSYIHFYLAVRNDRIDIKWIMNGLSVDFYEFFFDEPNHD